MHSSVHRCIRVLGLHPEPAFVIALRANSKIFVCDRNYMMFLLLADGRLVLLLEGGYSFQGLSEGVCNSFQALTGGQPLHEVDSSGPAEPGRAVDKVVDEVVAIHKL